MEEAADEEQSLLSREAFVGGQTRLMGASYFWFFATMMFLTAILFVPVAVRYKEKTYIQDEDSEA